MAPIQDDNQQNTLMVTQDGLLEMQKELEERITKQTEIATEIDEARQLGDLRENEPYQNAMQKKEINDARIEELEYMISVAQVVDGDHDGVVGIGSKVTIISGSSKREKQVTIVGREAAQEADPTEGKVSIDSPVGSALIGHVAGDKVEVDLPVGSVTYTIKEVA